MNLNYIKSQSYTKPELVDTTSSKKVVYLHQNITEVIATDEQSDENRIYYEYEEAKLTKEEYEQYLDELSSTETLEDIESLKTENQTLTEQIDMLMNCVLEMSELVYV